MEAGSTDTRLRYNVHVNICTHTRLMVRRTVGRSQAAFVGHFETYLWKPWLFTRTVKSAGNLKRCYIIYKCFQGIFINKEAELTLS